MSPQPPTPVAGRITWRTLLKATTATAAALAELETPAEAAASFVKGADIDWVPQMEARGYSGNEINSGICRPVGSVSNPAQMTGRINAACTQVKAVSPNSTVCIHLAQPQKCDVMTTFSAASRRPAARGTCPCSPPTAARISRPGPWGR
ncbi:glycosyl hydrolase 53 family protein [Streptomyces sp. NPDC006132]|uniref:glycosyl hydrolase 53 family protein n=1 Tax=Streptomyces sp. NPDC006132 TaxID=3156732 RepID=UPI0033ECFFF9